MPGNDATAGTADGATIASETAEETVQVLLPLPLDGAYDYTVPKDIAVMPGGFVTVPLGPRTVIGVVWGPGTGGVDPAKIKPIIDQCDLPALPEPVRRFVDWVAGYTLAPPGTVLRMVTGVDPTADPPAPRLVFTATDNDPPSTLRMTPARRRVLETARALPPLPAADLAREAGCGVSVVKGLADAGVLETSLITPRPPGSDLDGSGMGPPLSPKQRAAADALIEAVDQGQYSATLLDGVTGSGKTEVYFEAIAAALAAGRQVLVLLPEIALTADWLDRFAARFGARPAEWHSDLGRKDRRLTWRGVADGSVRVVVGARSALFLPYPNLGLIVVDEEHDSAYKQEDGVLYHARDMGVARAHLGGFPIILASATPSIETLVNVERGRYGRVQLPSRHGGAALPTVTLIDLRQDTPPRQRFLSPSLRIAIDETLAANEQAMLFLNRRGYAPLTVCRSCGHRMTCPNCTAWLVEHRYRRRLQCHHCGYEAALPSVCPECHEQDSFAACGPGVERIAEEILEIWPEARTSVLASDTLHGPAAIHEAVRAVRDHEIDIVIGTQVVAKGHHFPMLTLVGVVDADIGLAGGDPRATERTFQLLHQVAGRAGRGDRPGRALIQTHDPSGRVMAALAQGDRDQFLDVEIAEREAAGLPPFGKLASVILSGPDGDRVEQYARRLAREAPRGERWRILGPAPAALALLRGRFRWRLLLRAHSDVRMQRLMRDWLDPLPPPSGVQRKIDIDPQSFL